MNIQELGQMIDVIRTLRRGCSSSEVARRLELQVCGEILLLLPMKTDGPDDIVFPGHSKNVARAVVLGIIGGRAGDPAIRRIRGL